MKDMKERRVDPLSGSSNVDMRTRTDTENVGDNTSSTILMVKNVPTCEERASEEGVGT